LKNQLAIHYNALSKNEYSCVNDFVSNWLDDSDVISVNTSGSTGAPKTIQLFKSQMQASAHLTGSFFEFSPSKTVLICLNSQFIAGKMMLVRALEFKTKVVLCDPQDVLAYPDDIQIDFAAMVPLQVEKCLKNNFEKLKKIKSIIIGGAPIHKQLERQIVENGLNAYATFGMTETTSHIALRRVSQQNEPYFALGDTTFSQGNKGQLIIHAPSLGIDALETNDSVELCSSTSFRWLGRLDYAINSGGIKFHPEVLERKIDELNWGRRFFIAGIPDDSLGEKIVLCIEGEQSMDTTDLKTCLTNYEMPRSIVYVSSFVETLTGKINRIETLKQVYGDS
jgi:o-succinylbenzoate---CoA ligase